MLKKTLFFAFLALSFLVPCLVSASTALKDDYQAELLALSAHDIVIKNGGEAVNFIVRFLNTGNRDWQSYSWQEAGSVVADMRKTSSANIADTSWQNARIITSASEQVQKNKPLGIIYSFRAPAQKGKYQARVELRVDGRQVSGGRLDLPIEVLNDAPEGYAEPVLLSPSAEENYTEDLSAQELIDEPYIRVGLYKTDKKVEIQSEFRYEIFAGSVSKGFLEPNVLAAVSYKNEKYSFASADQKFTSKDFIRLVPEEKDAYFELVNYSRPVSWKGKKNFNVYRGIFEYRYSPKSKMPYVINELPLDQYIAGIGETSNGAAIEYIKAVLIAARSYAYAAIKSTPTPKNMFNVYATTVDQLYLGYNSEVLMPRVAQAAKDTYGQMVKYNNDPIQTFYFANSDGRTRSWSEKYNRKDVPWLQSVECKYDKGKKMYGHGVGMSTADAAARAAKDGWTYDQLLKYYYTGVEVERVY